MKYNLILLLAAVTLVLNSCGKKGCTDDLAFNFDKKAKKDNNTCEYKAKAALWFNKASSDEFKRRGVDHLEVYLNDVLTSTISTGTYFTSAPDCETSGASILEKELGKVKAQNYRFKAKDPFGFIIYDNVLEMKAGTCMTIQLGL